MGWNFNSERPIYLQIADKLCTDIISGFYSKGEKLPGVRELASIAAVNPNTMQRALTELEQSGLIETQSTNGRFVNSSAEKVQEAKEKLAKLIASEYFKKMSDISYAPDDAKKFLEQYCEEEK